MIPGTTEVVDIGLGWLQESVKLGQWFGMAPGTTEVVDIGLGWLHESVTVGQRFVMAPGITRVVTTVWDGPRRHSPSP